MKKLSPAEFELLRDVITRRDRPALAIVDTLGQTPLTIETRERLREALAAEMAETGFRDDDEPNSRGRTIDQLIARLGHF